MEHWHDSEPDRPDEPAAAVLRAFPAPGRAAAWLRRQPAADQHWPGDQLGRDRRPGEQVLRWPSEQGLRWPPAESWWSGPEYSVTGASRDTNAGIAGSAAGGSSAGSGSRQKPGRLDWLLDDLDKQQAPAQDRSFSFRYDAAPGVASGSGERFAAKWSAPGTSPIPSRPAVSLPRRLQRFQKDGGVMARRALLERSAELTADDQVLPRQPHPVRPEKVTSHWRGAGGRWLIWVARAVVWAALLLIGYRGVLAIIQGTAPSTPARSSQPNGSTQFPVTSAEAYALEFGDVYLNFSPATPAARSQDLARFLPPGSDPRFGLTGMGTQRMVDDQVAAITVTGRHTAIVKLLARLNGGRLIELGVPIYAAAGGMSVSGYPALLPGPAKASPPPVSQLTSDQATEATLQTQLPAFFQAYAGGDQGTLARFTAPGAHITGLRNEVSFGGIDSVYVPGGGSTRQISVTVSWQLPSTDAKAAKPATVGAAPVTLQMTYEMTVVRRGGSWDIRSIGGSTRPLSQGPP